MQKKPKKNIDIILWVFCIVVGIVLPLAWLASTPVDSKGYRADARTRSNLDLAEKNIDHFRQQFKRLPVSLTELRTFSKSIGKKINSHDAYGQRLQYVKLDDAHFVLRSFGADSVQNTIFTAADPNVADWNKLQPTPQYQFQHRLQRLTYPAVLLAGADSPNKQWQAKLYVDPAVGQSRLIVRHRERSELLMLALHEQVEEFLWLPDSHRLIYTATGSVRYRDGVYLWDLLEDSTTNLLDEPSAKVGITSLSQTKQLWLSLAGIVPSGPLVFFFAAPIQQEALDPTAFYNTTNFFVAKISAAKDRRSNVTRANVPEHLAKLVPWTDMAAQITSEDTTSEMQNRWLRLPLAGVTENVIHEWQNFIEAHPQAPLSPYGLWILTSLFSDTYALLQQSKNKSDSETIRSFGAEIANALRNYPLSPAYLHGFGLFAFHGLTERTPLPYQISKLHLP